MATTYACAMALIVPAAANTVRCSMPSCWRRSTSRWFVSAGGAQFETITVPRIVPAIGHGDANFMDSPLVALYSGMDVLETHQLQPRQLGHTAWHEIFLFDAIERVPIDVALI